MTMVLCSFPLHTFGSINNHFMGCCESFRYQASESAVSSYIPELKSLTQDVKYIFAAMI